MGVGLLDDLDTVLAIDCPRCGRAVEQQFYGPCERCLGELRAIYQAAADSGAMAAVAVEYEPKMNVTPNAVALKDD